MSKERFNNPRIGIIGFGYVGRAIHYGFKNVAKIRIFDIDKSVSKNTFKETIKNSDYIFICVPTPTNLETNECDISIIDKTIEASREFMTPCKTLIIKSSIPPGSTKKLTYGRKHLNIIYNPEFLTEKNYKDDFINPSRVILGGPTKACLEVVKLYRKIFPYDTIPIYTTDYKTAETVKYLSNAFLSCKVSIFNEFYDICNKLNLNFKEVTKLITADNRINTSHTVVPGHDGDRGFGGKCFPKDLLAIIKKSEDLKVDPIIMKACWDKNLKVRKNKDWEAIRGAVTHLKG